MVRIPSDHRRTPLVAFHQHANRVRSKRHHRCKIQRLAQHHAIRLLHVRNNVFLNVGLAAGKPREGQRGRHQFQEISPVHAFVPLRGLPRKLPVQQFLKVGVLGQLFQRPPILFPALAVQFRAHCSQIQGMLT